MQEVIVIERSDRDDGTSHMWVSCQGERARFSISTATLNSKEGPNILSLMACRATDLVKTARERGQLGLES